MHIDKNSPEIDLIAKLNRGDGVCKFFNVTTHLCSIYNDRPLLCNVDRSYDELFSTHMSRDEYYRLNYDSCLKIKLLYGGKNVLVDVR